ncbi:hypothetical protein ANTPLA_LOCUS6025 [Anthophora plagiata]
MGKCCSCFSKFRAVFRTETVTDSPLKPLCTKPECLPRPPAARNSGKFRETAFTGEADFDRRRISRIAEIPRIRCVNNSHILPRVNYSETQTFRFSMT